MASWGDIPERWMYGEILINGQWPLEVRHSDLCAMQDIIGILGNGWNYEKYFFFFFRWDIFLIRFQQSNSDWKCCSSAFLSRILTPFQTFSRSGQDDWMVPQCRFISIHVYPVALLILGHPREVNPLRVSSWVDSGGALLHSLPSLYSSLLLCIFQIGHPQDLKFLKVSEIIFLRVLLIEVSRPPGKHCECVSVIPSAGLHTRYVDQHWRERRGFLQRSLIPPAEQPEGGRALWSVWLAGNCSAGVICPAC